MTTLNVSDFDEFFAELNGGCLPFSWQKELVDHIVSEGRWPDQISAPTGAGKSSVVDVHVFVNALSAVGLALRLPRRLHTVVNRRGLVDNQHQRALYIQERLRASLESPDVSAVLNAVATALQTFQVREEENPIAVSVLRGGLSSRSLPVSDLSSCAVIASTPDMWGSRALFQGYGSSLYARPRETTLMTADSAIVLDEAHLNRQLLKTARRIREIQLSGVQTGIPALQVVETTATPTSVSPDSKIVTVEPTALDSGRDDALQQRLTARKQIRHVSLPKWNGRKANSTVVATSIEQIQNWLQSEQRAGTIGCIVNHVDTAVKIASDLRKKDVHVALLVGRMRPYDLQQLQENYPGLLTPQGNDDVDVIVATQTLEVGVDVDFQHLVTELAPASALQQRIGRLNRLGLFENSELVILQPESSDSIKNDYPPYLQGDLVNGLSWINSFSEGSDVNPEQLLRNPAPANAPERLLYQRLEKRDVELLAKTSELRSYPFELELWLRDSLEEETPVAGVAVRYDLPQAAEAAVELLNTLPPRENEVFPGTIAMVRDLVQRMLDDDPYTEPQALFIYNNDEVQVLTKDSLLQPGDVVVLGVKEPFTTENVLVDNPQDKSVPKEVDMEGVDVFIQGKTSHIRDEVFRSARELSPEEFLELWYETFPKDKGRSVEVSVSSVEDARGDMAAWILVRDSADLKKDGETLQEWTPRGDSLSTPPTLAQHQKDVADRARKLCSGLGVQEEISVRVEKASLLHDEGKADERFQIMLGNTDLSAPVAKSTNRSRQQIMKAKAGSGLPAGWRHEQYSAVIAEDMRSQGDESIDDLVVHIVGTSHGRGRDLFPQVGEQLVDDSDTANVLFSEGQWESRARKLTREYGAYTLALCESLERAADAQISGEGR